MIVHESHLNSPRASLSDLLLAGNRAVCLPLAVSDEAINVTLKVQMDGRSPVERMRGKFWKSNRSDSGPTPETVRFSIMCNERLGNVRQWAPIDNALERFKEEPEYPPKEGRPPIKRRLTRSPAWRGT